jgi:hypothetical protein
MSFKTLVYLVGSIPILHILIQIGFYLYLYSVIGSFPVYCCENSKELEINNMYYPIFEFTIQLWFYSAIIWLCILIAWFITRENLEWKPVILTTLAQILFIANFNTSMTNWIFD